MEYYYYVVRRRAVELSVVVVSFYLGGVEINCDIILRRFIIDIVVNSLIRLNALLIVG